MDKRMTVAGVAGVLVLVLLAAGCSDPASPPHRGPGVPAFAAAPGTGITIDQQNGTFGDVTPYGSGSHIGKGFTGRNPHLGDAVIATFFWRGTSNNITIVTDHLSNTDATPIGNNYTLVEYATAGGISMATYVATNVQGFLDADTASDSILTVHALFSSPVSDGGILISAWRGVNAQSAAAMGTHQSASGSSSSTATADPGTMAVGAGALAYGVTMSNAVVGVAPPAGFTYLTPSPEDTAMATDGEYAVPANGGSVDPQWTWYFRSPSTWLATVLALNPAALHLVFTVQPSTTLPLMTITPAVQVTVVDDQGNPVTGYTGSVTIAIGHNGGMLLPGTLSGTKTATAVNGVATFSDLSIDQPGNGYTLTVAGSGVTGAESGAFNISPF